MLSSLFEVSSMSRERRRDEDRVKGGTKPLEACTGRKWFFKARSKSKEERKGKKRCWEPPLGLDLYSFIFVHDALI